MLQLKEQLVRLLVRLVRLWLRLREQVLDHLIILESIVQLRLKLQQ
jgi:hypothetical protein